MANNPILEAASSSIPSKPTGVTTEIPKESETAPRPSLNTETSIVNPIIKQAEQFAAKSAASGEEQKKLIKQQQDVLSTITSAAEQSVKAANIIEGQKNVAELQAQNANIQVFKAAGGTDFLTTLAQEQQQAAQKIIEYTDKLDEIRGGGDNIISAIINEIIAIPTALKLEGAQREFDSLNKAAQNINAMTESSARAHAVTKESLNEASIQAAQEKMAADMQLALGETQLKALQSNAALLQAAMDADARTLDAHLTAYKVRNEELNREIRLKEYQISAAAAERAATDWREGREVRVDVTAGVKRGMAVLGLPIEDDTTIRYGLQQPPNTETGKRYAKLFEIGMQSNGSIGATPADAIINTSVVATSGISKSPEGDIMESIKTSAMSKIGTPGQPATLKSEEEYKTFVNKEAKALQDTYKKNIASGDTSNWYHAPNFSILAENSKAVKESKLYKKVLEPLNMEEFDTGKIASAAVAGIKAKAISIEEATNDINTIVKAAMAYNNEHKKFSRIGLEDQESYNTKAEIPGALFATRIPVLDWGFRVLDVRQDIQEKLTGQKGIPLTAEKQVIDWADPTQVRNLMVRAISSAALGESFTDTSDYQTTLETEGGQQ